MHYSSLLATIICLAMAGATPVGPAKNSVSSVKHSKGKWFDRIVVINLENSDFADAENDHYLSVLAEKGVLLTQYSGVTHPSQPNYIAQVYGDTHNITDDSWYDIKGKSLVDLLEAKDVSWKAYQEKFPGSCFTGKGSEDMLYVHKHNPFISMNTVNSNPDLCAKVVDEKQLDRDIAANKVPQLVYYTPDMNNDGHDTGVSYASEWLRKFLSKRFSKPSFTKNTLFFVTFDEREDYDGGDNLVFTVMFGPVVDAWKGRKDNRSYSHYSLLRTIEENWSLGSLGRNDKNARVFNLPARK